MNYKIIKELMKEMNQTDLTKLEIEEDGYKVSMEKVPVNLQTAESKSVSYKKEAIKKEAINVEAEEKAEPEEITGQELLSPMVGTFYASPAPDEDPFVEIGDKVKKGQTLCIIEAMKLMNEIESEYDGVVVDVLVENEDMIEYGQPLFLIR